MTPQNYAKELYNHWIVSKEGPQNALYIAKKQVEATDPKAWQDLPVGPVFATKGYGSERWDLNVKELRKIHNFWVEVYNLLKKRF